MFAVSGYQVKICDCGQMLNIAIARARLAQLHGEEEEEGSCERRKGDMAT